MVTKQLLRVLFVVTLLTALIGTGTGALAASGDPVLPGEVRVDATFESIGVVWFIAGDDNLDSTMTLEFRTTGSSTWLPGAIAMRAYPTIRVQDGPLGINSWGASALFLEPGTSYDLRLTLTDPDGGGMIRTVTGITRTVPVPDPAGTTRFVVPGSGGGTGTQVDPFRGLQAAADAANPGDELRIAAGTYAPFEITRSGEPGRPIAFTGPESGEAIIDGAGTTRGVVTVGRWDRTTSDIIVAGLTIESGRWGIDAQNTRDLLISDNIIRDVDFGILNRRGNANELNQTITDNVITGRTPWPGSGIPSERGIDLRGTGNVVRYNRVQFFGDCISVQPFTGPSYGNDVYGNDVSYCVDDGIEIDYNQANVRVWRNRVTNARMGVSVQPIRGGPAYIVRNEFFNLESVPIKMHNYTTGFVVAHNTGVKNGDGHGDNGAMWRNAIFRNNLFIGTRYAFEFTTVADEGFRDFDNNAWGTTQAIGGPSAPWFKWDNVRYSRIGDLPAGVEDKGVEVTMADLLSPTLPPAWNVASPPGTASLQLVSGSAAIDRGAQLANLNDGFAIAGNPDIGAFEFGKPMPTYGPRSGPGDPGPADPDAVTVGMVDPDTGLWRLRDSIGVVTSFYYGNPGDLPFAGDWDCDGVDTPGLYRQSDGYVYLRNANTQGNAGIKFFFGNPGDIPLAGDFNGDDCDTVSIYRPSEARIYIINELGSNDGGLGAADYSYLFGNVGDKPFVADFDGDGVDTVGLHRESTGFMYYRNTNSTGIAHAQFYFGDPGDRVIAGDWNASGSDSPGVFRPSAGRVYLRYTNTQGNADDEIVWGNDRWLPIAGAFHLH